MHDKYFSRYRKTGNYLKLVKSILNAMCSVDSRKILGDSVVTRVIITLRKRFGVNMYLFYVVLYICGNLCLFLWVIYV